MCRDAEKIHNQVLGTFFNLSIFIFVSIRLKRLVICKSLKYGTSALQISDKCCIMNKFELPIEKHRMKSGLLIQELNKLSVGRMKLKTSWKNQRDKIVPLEECIPKIRYQMH